VSVVEGLDLIVVGVKNDWDLFWADCLIVYMSRIDPRQEFCC
jgi:hypothetical protein